MRNSQGDSTCNSRSKSENRRRIEVMAISVNPDQSENPKMDKTFEKEVLGGEVFRKIPIKINSE